MGAAGAARLHHGVDRHHAERGWRAERRRARERGCCGKAAREARAGQTRRVRTAVEAEESATIQDDPTLIPDDKESADNNVTFPVDI